MTAGYDEAACITAGELRALGVPVPEHVPACGWVPRNALRMVPVSAGLKAEGVLSTLYEMHVDAPFRWVETAFTVDKPEGEI